VGGQPAQRVRQPRPHTVSCTFTAAAVLARVSCVQLASQDQSRERELSVPAVCRVAAAGPTPTSSSTALRSTRHSAQTRCRTGRSPTCHQVGPGCLQAVKLGAAGLHLI
jgi:hypothetical protein